MFFKTWRDSSSYYLCEGTGVHSFFGSNRFIALGIFRNDEKDKAQKELDSYAEAHHIKSTPVENLEFIDRYK